MGPTRIGNANCWIDTFSRVWDLRIKGRRQAPVDENKNGLSSQEYQGVADRIHKKWRNSTMDHGDRNYNTKN